MIYLVAISFYGLILAIPLGGIWLLIRIIRHAWNS